MSAAVEVEPEAATPETPAAEAPVEAPAPATEANAGAVETPPAPPPAPEPKPAKALALIAQREAQFRAEKESLEKRAAELAAKELEWTRYREAEDLFRRGDNRGGLAKLQADRGRVYQDLTDEFLQKPPAPADKTAALEAKLAALEKSIADRYTAEQQASGARLWEQNLAEAASLAASGKYELIAARGSDAVEEVVKYRAGYAAQYGEVLTMEACADKIESALEEQALTLVAAPKLRAKLGLKAPASPSGDSAAQASTPRTLQNKMTQPPPPGPTSPAGSDEEEFARLLREKFRADRT